MVSLNLWRRSHGCCAGGAGILFTISVLWYWGSKRKVMALDSQKVLLADLFRIKHPADEDDRQAAVPPFLMSLCSCWEFSEGTLKRNSLVPGAGLDARVLPAPADADNRRALLPV